MARTPTASSVPMKLGLPKVQWRLLPFRFVVIVSALYYLIWGGAVTLYHGLRGDHPGLQYQDFMLGGFSVLLALMLWRQYKAPEKSAGLMQVAALSMALFVVADAFLPGGQGWGLAVLQAFLLFDLVMLHPAGDRLKKW